MNIPDSYRLKKADIEAGNVIFDRYGLRHETVTDEEFALMTLVYDAECFMHQKKITRMPTVGEVRAWRNLPRFQRAAERGLLYDRRTGVTERPDRFESVYRAKIEREQKEALNGTTSTL